MGQLEPSRAQPRLRPEVLGLGVLFLCGLAGWISLLSLGAKGRPFWPREADFQVWRELAWLGALGVIAAYASRKCGLLALACEARGRAPLSAVQRWLCLLAHFKLSFAVLLASLAASWWGRIGLLLWMLDPAAWPWGRSARLSDVHFGMQGPPLLLITLTVAWLPVVPFLASDVWRLLRPLMTTRAGKLHLPFALASLVAAVVAVLLIRQHLVTLFAMFGPPLGTAL